MSDDPYRSAFTIAMLRLITPYGRSAPSARVRGYAWLNHLKIEAEVVKLTDAEKLSAKNAAHSYARQVLHGRQTKSEELCGSTLILRKASLLGAGKVEETVFGRSQHAVFDLDDAIYLPSEGVGPRALLRKAARQKRQPGRAARAADVVVAGNATLADWASHYCENVVVIPSCVEPASYKRKLSYELVDPPLLLWVGSASTEPLLGSLVEPLRRINEIFGARLLLIGQAQGSVRGLDFMIDRIPWSERVASSRIADADIGLMPLTDTAFNRGKCAYKLLQYGAAGLPAIGSPVGANTPLLAAAGLPAPTNNTEWFGAIHQLLEMSAAERQGLGTGFHELVSRDFSYERWASNWIEAVQPFA